MRRVRKRRPRRWPIVVLVLTLLVLVSALCLRFSWNDILERQYPLKYSEIVEREADEFNLDPMLVYAVIRAESGFDASAGSTAGACGLMQLMPVTFSWMQTKLGEEGRYAEEDIFLPEVNIRYGCALLRLLIDLYESEETALCAYNAGMGTVSEWLDDPALSPDGVHLSDIPYGETKHYLQRVLQNREMYIELYAQE